MTDRVAQLVGFLPKVWNACSTNDSVLEAINFFVRIIQNTTKRLLKKQKMTVS